MPPHPSPLPLRRRGRGKSKKIKMGDQLVARCFCLICLSLSLSARWRGEKFRRHGEWGLMLGRGAERRRATRQPADFSTTCARVRGKWGGAVCLALHVQVRK